MNLDNINDDVMISFDCITKHVLYKEFDLLFLMIATGIWNLIYFSFEDIK